MQTLPILLAALWQQYTSLNPEAEAIHRLLRERGDQIVNDHIAFRTIAHARVDIERFAALLAPFGYAARGEYTFPDKHLTARHFESPEPDAPRIFVSQLHLGECSPFLRETMLCQLDAVTAEAADRPELLHAGRIWAPVAYTTWQQLRAESEYAAWLAAFGFCANHFTISVNALHSVPGLAELVGVLRAAGYRLNEAGGVIKGSPDVYLEQASTLAPPVKVTFADGEVAIPGCYVEFARRYPQPDGSLFSGFLAANANRIFESTHAGHRHT